MYVIVCGTKMVTLSNPCIHIINYRSNIFTWNLKNILIPIFRSLFSEWCTKPQLSHSVFSSIFVSVLSWQRHFLSDSEVFCIVTLKAPWIALGVTCYLCQVKLDLHSLYIPLTHHSRQLNGGWPLPSITMNNNISLYAHDWPV